MSQAWHARRHGPANILDASLDAEAMRWRATKYGIRDDGGRPIRDSGGRTMGGADSGVVVEAAADARWERFSPFDSYRAAANARDLTAGPHLLDFSH